MPQAVRPIQDLPPPDGAEPFDHAVAGLAPVALPYHGSPTRALIQFPMRGVPSSARHGALLTYPSADDLVGAAFGAAADGGAIVVRDTGFAP